MRRCTYCAEEIQDEAVKCKHCMEWLGEGGGNRRRLENPEGGLDPDLLCMGRQLSAIADYLLDRNADRNVKYVRLLRTGKGILEGFGIEADIAHALQRYRD